MLIETLSTFPHMYDSVMGESMMKRAQEKGILQFRAHDLRDWTYDRHRTTDDYPYGGGAGLVMKCQPIFEAVDDILQAPSGMSGIETKSGGGLSGDGSPDSFGALGSSGLTNTPKPSSPSNPLNPPKQIKPRVIFLAPTGRKFDDAYADELSHAERILFVCGHYEGIDERAYSLATDVISLGDYVLTSGELASMIVIDALVRKIPGVLGAENGASDESFACGLLEYPQYTRPATFRGMDVPDVLVSGNHAKIAEWRRHASLERTAQLRPDLIEQMTNAGKLSPADLDFLDNLS